MGKEILKPSELYKKMLIVGAVYVIGLIIVLPVVFFSLIAIANPTIAFSAAALVFIVATIIFFMKLIPVYKKTWSMADDFYLRSGGREAPEKKRKS